MKRKKMLCLTLAISTVMSLMSVSASAEEQTTLTMMSVRSDDSQFMKDLISAYEEAHPNVKVEHISTTNAELKKQLKIAALADEMPDIVCLDNPDFASFIAGDYMMDITDYVSDWEDMEYFYDGVMAPLTYKDRVYGLPWEANCLGFIYNKDILEKAGYEAPEYWTWEDVTEACEAVSALDDGTYGLAIAAPQGEVATFQYIPWLYSAGGSYEKLDSDAAVEALSFLADLVEKGYMSKEVMNYSHGDLINAFKGQQCAMMVNGSWATAQLADLDFEWKCATMPVLNEGDTSVTCLGGYHAGITTSCKNVDVALDMLKMIASKDWSYKFAVESGTLPVRSDVAEEAYFQEYPVSVFANSMEAAVSRVNVFWPELSENIYTAVQSALSGEMSAEEALANAEALNADYWS